MPGRIKQWPEILGAAEHRMKFVQDSLQYESNKDKGLDYLRSAYAAYLPEVGDSDDDQDESGEVSTESSGVADDGEQASDDE